MDGLYVLYKITGIWMMDGCLDGWLRDGSQRVEERNWVKPVVDESPTWAAREHLFGRMVLRCWATASNITHAHTHHIHIVPSNGSVK